MSHKKFIIEISEVVDKFRKSMSAQDMAESLIIFTCFGLFNAAPCLGDALEFIHRTQKTCLDTWKEKNKSDKDEI